MYCWDTLVNVTYETDTIHAFVIVIFEKLPLVHITLSNVPIDAFMRHVLTSIDVIFDEGAGGMTNKKKDDEYYLNHTTYIFFILPSITHEQTLLLTVPDYNHKHDDVRTLRFQEVHCLIQFLYLSYHNTPKVLCENVYRTL